MQEVSGMVLTYPPGWWDLTQWGNGPRAALFYSSCVCLSLPLLLRWLCYLKDLLGWSTKQVGSLFSQQEGLAVHGQPCFSSVTLLFCKLLASWCGEECMKYLRTAEWDSSSLSWNWETMAHSLLWSWPGCICREIALSKLCWSLPNWSWAWKQYERVCPVTVIAMRCCLVMKLPWGIVERLHGRLFVQAASYKLCGGQVAAWRGLDVQCSVTAQSSTLGWMGISVCCWNPPKLPVHQAPKLARCSLSVQWVYNAVWLAAHFFRFNSITILMW